MEEADEEGGLEVLDLDPAPFSDLLLAASGGFTPANSKRALQALAASGLIRPDSDSSWSNLAASAKYRFLIGFGAEVDVEHVEDEDEDGTELDDPEFDSAAGVGFGSGLDLVGKQPLFWLAEVMPAALDLV